MLSALRLVADGLFAAASKLQVSPLRQTIRPFGSSRDDKFFVANFWCKSSGKFSRVCGGGLEGAVEGGAGEEAGGVQRGEGGVFVVEDEGDFGAAEDYGVAAFLLHAGDDALEGGDGFGLEDAVDELVHDDAVDGLALGGVGAEEVDVVGGELVGVDAAFDEVAGSGEGDAMEAAGGGVGGDDFGDVEPGEGRAGGEEGEGLVDGVVGTDEEVGADAGEFGGGGEHEVGDGGPVVAMDGAHVLGE